jgi:hypothetical protein
MAGDDDIIDPRVEQLPDVRFIHFKIVICYYLITIIIIIIWQDSDEDDLPELVDSKVKVEDEEEVINIYIYMLLYSNNNLSFLLDK